MATLVLAQEPIPVQFQTAPVLSQTGSEAVFTVLTGPDIFSMTWKYQDVTVALWAVGVGQVNPLPQFQGRVTISKNQLRIGGAQLRDAGNYTVQVDPAATTGLAPNSRSVQLRVFDAVAGVSLFVPSVALEEGNVSLSCTWTAGTEITVQWGKGGSAITADSRITISGGSLVINPARRGDAGEYTCTASNPVSAQTATASLTVYYGPDAAVLTVDRPKECIGGGDVLVGQTARLTCTSDSLPPALFSWQRDGQPIASGQPDSGVLSLQTFSTDESGRYVCTARNAITGGTSERSTNLEIVDVCLDGGEVAGIVIGCFLAVLLIVLLIVVLICLARRKKAQQTQRETLVARRTYSNRRPIPPDPQPDVVRDLAHGLQPPLYTRRPERLNTSQRESHPQTQPQNRQQNSVTPQHNSRTDTNRLLNNAIQNPPDGIDNPAFVHAVAPITNTLPYTQQQNPSVLIQTGTGQGGAQPQAVQVSLNPLPPAAHPNNAQMPSIHVNLNSYPANDPQPQQGSSFPVANAAQDSAPHTQHNQTPARHTNPHMQGGQSYPNDGRPAVIPTGHTQFYNTTLQRNANTQTYQQDPDPRGRSERNSRTQEPSLNSSHRQMPWDLLRGTPSYPSGTLQRAQRPPEYTSDYTDHSIRPPAREARAPLRSQPQSQTPSRSRRTPPRRDPPSEESGTRSRSADRRPPNPASVAAFEPVRRPQRSPHTQRQSAQPDIRGSQAALRHETAYRDNPQALPGPSQQASASRSARSRAPAGQREPTAPPGADTRALADPNHLQRAIVAQQHTAAPVQMPQALVTHTGPAVPAANQHQRGGTAPAPNRSAEPNPGSLTQDALKAHTERSQVFQNRTQQTQAALLQPGPQKAQAGATGAQQRPPTPPPRHPPGPISNPPQTARSPQVPRERPAASQTQRAGSAATCRASPFHHDADQP
ncbi:unnamed protein product [Menidia menidia]|uniref:(Atlantic silverside) hypothetical protein n=1 Tax=Menidia menidia TaxID=238744 RepID=A0A8S4BS32_9TELE|nr:unnamed protein product [Menidia menidia]